MAHRLLARKFLPLVLGNVKQVSVLPFSQRLMSELATPEDSVLLSAENQRLVVNWKDSTTDQYPFVWLRDNCQCPQCFDSSSQSRTINLSLFKTDHQPSYADIKDSMVEIVWNDGHKSAYSSEWLLKRSFQRESQLKWLHLDKLPYQTWTAGTLLTGMPQLPFKDVICKDDALLEFLQHLEVKGVCILNKVPQELGQVRILAERVAFIKRTHYGEEYSVQTKPNAANVAYTSGYLQLHTDLPYYQYKPGVNLLHCYIQHEGQGGDSLISDGFRAAELVRLADPEAYRILTKTMVPWSDIGEENGLQFHKIHRAPVICENVEGDIERINFSQPQRDSFLSIPIDQVEGWYRALKLFCDTAHHPTNLLKFKLRPGQLLAFDNIRVLHGRTGFDGERHVQGGYLDWDEIRSKMRILRSALTSNK